MRQLVRLYCLLQGQIQWIEVNSSTILYHINVSNAAGHLYGVAVKQSGDQYGPIHWASCLHHISESMCFSIQMCVFVDSRVMFALIPTIATVF